MIVEFVAQRACQLAGARFTAGDSVRVTLAAPDQYDPEDGLGDGGPWGWGGYRSITLTRIAAKIEALENGRVIWTRPAGRS
jgi:hypothetical protein